MIRLRLTTIVVLLFLSSTVFSQALPEAWSRVYHPQGRGQDRPRKIKVDQQGNIIIAGTTQRNFNYPDMFVIKYNSQGDTLWKYYYDTPNLAEDYLLDMDLDKDGNIYATGYSTNTNAFYKEQLVTIKLDQNGNQLWAKQYNVTGVESIGKSIAIDTTGNIYVAGYYTRNTTNNWMVVKYNPSGTILWMDTVITTPNSYEEAYDVAVGTDQNITVCGSAVTGTSGYDGYVKHYSSSGAVLWSDIFSNSTVMQTDEVYQVAYTNNGEIRVGGRTYSNPGSEIDVLLLSYTNAGVRQWATIYPDSIITRDELFTAMTVDDSGNTYITANNFKSQVIYRINADGSRAWRGEWRGPIYNTYNSANDIAVDHNGGVYTTGVGIYPGPDYFANGGLTTMTVVKFSTAGDSLWTYKQSSTTDLSLGWSVFVKDGNVYAAGSKADTADIDEDFYTVILDTAGTLKSEWKYSGESDAIIRGKFLKTDSQNNVYVGATCKRVDASYDHEGFDVVIVKYDPAGNLLWDKIYSDYRFRNDSLTAMDFDPSGNLILSISSDTSGDGTGYRISLVKMSAAGITLDTGWYNSSVPGSLFANSMLVRNDGSIILGSNLPVLGGSLICFDSQLNQQWTAQLDTTIQTGLQLNGIALFNDGDIAATGFIDTGGSTTRKIFVQRIELSGTRNWAAEIDSLNIRDEANDIAVSANGDVAVSGLSGTVAVTGKFNGTNGQLLWKSIYNNTSSTSEYGKRVRFTPAGSVVTLCGGFTGFVDRWYTVQYNGINGAEQWATGYSNVASSRYPLEMLVESNGRVVTAGFQVSGNTIPNYDYVLVGYNSTGVQQFANTWSTPGIYPDYLNALAKDNNGDFIVTGGGSYDFLNDYRFRMITVKYGRSAVGIEEENHSVISTKAYPNPSADGRFIIECGKLSPSFNATVYDMMGKAVKEINAFTSGDEIDLSMLPSGLYLFQNNNAKNETVRLLKN